MPILAKGLFDNLQIKHGIVDCTNCKYSLPGCLSHFAAETLERVFVGCSLGLRRSFTQCKWTDTTAKSKQMFQESLPVFASSLASPPHLLWEQRIPDCLRPRRRRNRGGQRSSQESSDLSSERDRSLSLQITETWRLLIPAAQLIKSWTASLIKALLRSLPLIHNRVSGM